MLGKLTAEVLRGGEVREFFTKEGEIVCCPWHGWEFEIPTGVCLADTRFRLQTFPVTVEDRLVKIVLP